MPARLMLFSPLYATFGSPFGPLSALPARPAIPDFKTPDCYRVPKVPPLENKLNAFSDEALLCVFYSMPRDIAQEKAAEEL
jgi:CCR4-NOT transcription complex subunit 2